MYANSTARRSRAGSTVAPSPRPRRAQRVRRLVGLALAGGLVAGTAACATAPAGEGEAAPPTFSRATGASLGYEEPLAHVTDLVGPAGEDDPLWTVAGSVFEPEEGHSVATVWTSEDGTDWQRDDLDPSGGDETVAAAARTADGIVAVGRVGSGSEADAAVWTRTGDGWSLATPAELGGDHEQWAFDVASGAGGTLVAGGENVWGDIRARIWHSSDGETWTSVDGGPGGPFDVTGEETVRAVAAFGDGFVAVGGRTLDGEQDGMVWFSPDGETWEAVEAPGLGGDRRQQVVSAVAVSNGIVAGGMSDVDGDGLGDPVVWLSQNGREWSAPVGPLPMSERRSGARDRSVRSLSFDEATGLIAAGGSDWNPAMWRSDLRQNGAQWTEMPDPVHGDLFQDGVDLRAAAISGSVAVAVGADPAILKLQGRRWEDATGDAFPKGGAQPFTTAVTSDGDGGMIAAGGLATAASGETRERLVGQLWASDGGTWEAIDSAGLAAGHVFDVTPFAGGVVAVGTEDFGLANGRLVADDDALPDGLMWISPSDGDEWLRIGLDRNRVPDEFLGFIDDPTNPGYAQTIAAMESEAPVPSVSPAGGPGTQSLNAVAAIGDGFITVGSVYSMGDGDPIILSSSDGATLKAETPPHRGAGTQVYSDVCVHEESSVAVAVGESGETGGYDAIAAARTPDGWVAGTGPFTGAGAQVALACAAGDEGFVAVGHDDSNGNRDARVWTSSDGIEWTEVESSILGGIGDQRATAIAAVPGGGWLVAGTDSASGDGDIALWRIDEQGEITRRDRGERALRGPGEQTVSSISIDEDGHVTLVGNDYGRAGIWESDSVDR